MTSVKEYFEKASDIILESFEEMDEAITHLFK